MADTDGQRIHKATPRRRQQARAEGQVAASQDLSSAATLLTGLCVLLLAGPPLARHMLALTTQHLSGRVPLSDDPASWSGHWRETIFGIGQIALPALLMITIVPLLVHLIQTGFLFHLAKVAPDVTRVSLTQGASRITSAQRWAQAGFGTIKLVLVLAIATVFVYGRRDAIAGMTSANLPELVAAMWSTMWQFLLCVAVALLAVATLDYGYRRWTYEHELMMTTQELRQEVREQEGDPQITSRRRTVQRQLALQRAAHRVSQASLLITDQRQLAVAIQLLPGSDQPLRVVAKGSGPLAAEMLATAGRHHVPVHHHQDLTVQLYRAATVDGPVPSQSMAAVTQLLANRTSGSSSDS